MNTDALVAELSGSLKPVKSTRYARICAEWLVVTIASFIIMGNISGFRADLNARMGEPLFVAEISLNLLLIIIAGLTACALAFPDRAKTPLLKPLLGLVFAGYGFFALRTIFTIPNIADSLANTAPHGIECLICILGFATAPALYMFWRLRKLAPVHPAQMGGAVMMMAVATGCLGVRLVENEIMPSGLLLWHYAPLLILSGVGLWLGRKLFRW